MLIEIDDEITDKVIIESLKLNIECLQNDIDRLSEKPTLKGFEQEDLDYCIDMLEHIEAVYDYFGGNL